MEKTSEMIDLDFLDTEWLVVRKLYHEVHQMHQPVDSADKIDDLLRLPVIILLIEDIED